MYATQVQPTEVNFFNEDNNNSNNNQGVKFNNITIPVVEVLQDSQTSKDGKYTGLSIKAAFQK